MEKYAMQLQYRTNKVTIAAIGKHFIYRFKIMASRNDYYFLSMQLLPQKIKLLADPVYHADQIQSSLMYCSTNYE